MINGRALVVGESSYDVWIARKCRTLSTVLTEFANAIAQHAK
jgi:hypothetical protein